MDCRSTKHLLLVWILPGKISSVTSDLTLTIPTDLYLEKISDSSPLSHAALEPLRIYHVNIYVSFGSGKLGVPLSCRVSEGSSAFIDAPQSSMIWENLRSSKADKNCVQIDRLASCFIPSSSMPSTEVLLAWAVDSVQKLPSGVVQDFYGPLYTFTAHYLRIGTRPLVSH